MRIIAKTPKKMVAKNNQAVTLPVTPRVTSLVTPRVTFFNTEKGAVISCVPNRCEQCCMKGVTLFVTLSVTKKEKKKKVPLHPLKKKNRKITHTLTRAHARKTDRKNSNCTGCSSSRIRHSPVAVLTWVTRSVEGRKKCVIFGKSVRIDCHISFFDCETRISQNKIVYLQRY